MSNDERLDGREHLPHVERRQASNPVKDRRSIIGRGEDAIEHERVEVHVQVQRATEALNHDYGAASAAFDALVPGPLAEHAEDRPHQPGGHGATQVVIPGQQIPQVVRQAEHPVAYGHVRQDVIDQVRRALGHTSSATARAEPTAFAGEGDQPVESTAGAVEPCETAGQPAAAEEVAKGLLDELRQALAVAQRRRLGAERLEVLTHNVVQHGVARRPLLIDRRR